MRTRRAFPIAAILTVAAVLSAAFTLSSCGAREGASAPKPEGYRWRIGIVFDIGGKDDRSFNQSAYEGLKRLAADFRGRIADDPEGGDHGDEVELRWLESKLEGADREQLLRSLADQGYDLVFGVGFLFADSIFRVANDYPRTTFVLIDGNIPDLDEGSNLICVSFAEEEGSFLAGVLAALLVEADSDPKVGFLGGMDMTLIRKFDAGFHAGAAYASPVMRQQGRVLSAYIGKDGSAFNDPGRASILAESMYAAGAGVIYHAAGASGAGLFSTAARLGKRAIGVDSDQGLAYASSADPAERDASRFILSSMLKRVDNAVYALSEELMRRGSIEGGYRVFGLADGGVALARNEANAEALAPYDGQLDSIARRIVAGEIRVPFDMEGLQAFLEELRR
ncbi:MAG: BMP family ABC transporter substrate-binding protein [Spirochaetia bacterium]|nr:BMP family ABC transporter substrate-binding protein [Spirochaetia bacterium]